VSGDETVPLWKTDDNYNVVMCVNFTHVRTSDLQPVMCLELLLWRLTISSATGSLTLFVQHVFN
jgi:hypothetical protein